MYGDVLPRFFAAMDRSDDALVLARVLVRNVGHGQSARNHEIVLVDLLPKFSYAYPAAVLQMKRSRASCTRERRVNRRRATARPT